MNWKIISRPTDTYEISPTDTQHEYIVYVQDAAGANIDGVLAYGKADRTKVTKELLSKYGKYIDKVEHEEK